LRTVVEGILCSVRLTSTVKQRTLKYVTYSRAMFEINSSLWLSKNVRKRYIWANESASQTSMSVLIIVGSKCTLAASHAAPGESQRICRRDRQTDGRQTVTLSFLLDAASVIMSIVARQTLVDGQNSKYETHRGSMSH